MIVSEPVQCFRRQTAEACWADWISRVDTGFKAVQARVTKKLGDKASFIIINLCPIREKNHVAVAYQGLKLTAIFDVYRLVARIRQEPGHVSPSFNLGSCFHNNTLPSLQTIRTSPPSSIRGKASHLPDGTMFRWQFGPWIRHHDTSKATLTS